MKTQNEALYKYLEIITSRIEKPLGKNAYGENHHIIPRCCGGGDEPSNIVRVSIEEHAQAHQLLPLIFTEGEEHRKLVHVAKTMKDGQPRRKMRKTIRRGQKQLVERLARYREGVGADKEQIQMKKHITREQVEELYGHSITKTTFQRWEKKGYLRQVQPKGTRQVFYDEEEVKVFLFGRLNSDAV